VPRQTKRRSLIPSLRIRKYSGEHCFYCGAKLRARTEEHVFPLWLQKRFQLQHQTITLLNRTTIKYSRLKVPCCRKCNNEHLSGLETRVKRCLRMPPSKLTRRQQTDLFTWACKILLGILYKERLLPHDRREPNKGPILPENLHDAYEMTHLIIQNTRTPIDFSAEGKKRLPGSVFIFKLKSPKELKMQFDFRDNVLNLAVFLRLGDRGIIAVADGGALDIEVGDLFRKDGKARLHPIQFTELGAIAFYKASLLNRTPKYLIFEIRKRLQILQMPLAGMSGKPVFDQWIQSKYAEHLVAFTGYPLDVIAPGDRSNVMQWRYDEKGNRLNVPMRKVPQPTKTL
jgi:hypothetical protein